jgi:nicotinate-nucleotide pyrophosphorylase (carboxylating)
MTAGGNTLEGNEVTRTLIGPDLDDLRRVVDTALAEDLRYGADATTAATVPADAVAVASFATRKPGVLAGIPAVRAVLDTVLGEGGYEVLSATPDGARIAAGDAVLTVRAPVRGLLTAERTALNLLCHLSGVATATAAWVDAVAGTRAQIRDTRKTLPGLRLLEKYAVRCGGGVNHRLGLGDAVLIKDNHVAVAGGVAAAIERVRRRRPGRPVEVEVDTLDQLQQALEAGADVILLDNMPPAQLRRAVATTAGRARLEASGGITTDTIREVAETGVDAISVGALTHSVRALDIALEVPPSAS